MIPCLYEHKMNLSRHCTYKIVAKFREKRQINNDKLVSFPEYAGTLSRN